MADIIHPNLPADLPTDWNTAQYVSPNGTEVGLSEKHGYNYLMRQLNDTQTALNTLARQTRQAVAGLEEGEYNATATRTGTTVAITGPDGAKAVTFLAPADWTEGDGYTYNGAEVALSDLNGGAVANAWTAGAPVTFYLTEGRAYFAAGASQLSPQEILDKLKTVDGAGSGLDADLLDGKQASEFAQLGTDGKIPAEQLPSDVGKDTAEEILEKLKTVDGVGSGLDADLLDGKKASEFAAAIHTHTADQILSGVLPVSVIATNSTDYGTSRLRNIRASTTDLTAGSSPLANGELYLVYE
ncbi:MAG: hypothetical protein KH009_03665 [Clostridiales bacterium]|nr:hypothetical protein [Clostridiales bacterium]